MVLLTFSTHLQGECTPGPGDGFTHLLRSAPGWRHSKSIFGTGRCTHLLHSPPGWRHLSLSSGPGDVLTFPTQLQGEVARVYLQDWEMYSPSPLTSMNGKGGTTSYTYLPHSAPGWGYSSLFSVLGDVLTFSAQLHGEGSRVYLRDWEMYLPSPLTFRVKALVSIFRIRRCTHLLRSPPEWRRSSLSSGPGDGFARRRVRSECCSCRAASRLAVRRWTVWGSWREGWATGPGPRRTGRSHQQQTPTNTWVSPMGPFALSINVKADTSDQFGDGIKFWSELEGHCWHKHCRSTDAVLTSTHSVNWP